MRLPYQVIVLLYKFVEGEPQFCVFQRRSPPVWQFVSGGGEDTESPKQAAIREVWEETGLHLQQATPLTQSAFLPAAVIDEPRRKHWPEPTYVIPEYAFAAEASGDVLLSNEHIAYRWCSYEEAHQLLRFDSNKIALYELACRLAGRVLPWSI